MSKTPKQMLFADGVGFQYYPRLYLCSLISHACYLHTNPEIAGALGTWAGYGGPGYVFTPGSTIPNFIFGHDDDTAVVAVAGTTAMNQLTNATVYSAGRQFLQGNGPNVHSFFLWCREQVEYYLFPLLQDLPGVSKVLFTGHSLGGATAELLAVRCNQVTGKETFAVAFGAPRVGGLGWRPYWRNAITDLTHVRRANDEVPGLPPGGGNGQNARYADSSLTKPLIPGEYENSVAPWFIKLKPLRLVHRDDNGGLGVISLVWRSTLGQIPTPVNKAMETIIDGHTSKKYMRELRGLAFNYLETEQVKFLDTQMNLMLGLPWSEDLESAPPVQPAIPSVTAFADPAMPPAPAPAPAVPPTPPVTVTQSVGTSIVAQASQQATGIAAGSGAVVIPGDNTPINSAAQAGTFPRENYLIKGNDRRLLQRAQAAMNGIGARDDKAVTDKPTQAISTRTLILDDQDEFLLYAWATVQNRITELLGLVKD